MVTQLFLVRYRCINIRSVNNKFDDFMDVFRDHQLTVVGLTETRHDTDSPVFGRCRATVPLDIPSLTVRVYVLETTWLSITAALHYNCCTRHVTVTCGLYRRRTMRRQRQPPTTDDLECFGPINLRLPTARATCGLPSTNCWDVDTVLATALPPSIFPPFH